MSHTLSASGVFMGGKLNGSGDLVPAEDFYDACRVMARHVRYLGDLNWDFSALHDMPIDLDFKRLVNGYLRTVLHSDAEHRGWKLPETVLALPWIVRMFPDINYIYWVRDPRDCILGGHMTDDLADFGIEYERTDDVREQRAISWKYQSEIYKATPRPSNLHEVRFEDLVLRQDETLKGLESFLGIPMGRIEMRPESVGRWKTAEGRYDFPFFREELEKYRYEMETAPSAAC